MEEKVVKQKNVILGGKSYIMRLTEKNLEEIRYDANIWKLNGWLDEAKFIEHSSYNVRLFWSSEALEIFRTTSPILKVGMGATMNLYSDYRAMTIIKVISPKKIVVAENDTECIDYYAGEYKVLDTIAEYMSQHIFTLRRNGTWVEEGQKKEPGSVTLTVGLRRHFIDPSF